MADRGKMEYSDRGLHLHRNQDRMDDFPVQTAHPQSSTTVAGGKPGEAKNHARMERVAEVGIVLGGAMAMYEKHQAKKDPENAHRHKVGEAIAAAVVAGSTVYAKKEHDEKKHEEEQGKHHPFDRHSHK